MCRGLWGNVLVIDQKRGAQDWGRSNNLLAKGNDGKGEERVERRKKRGDTEVVTCETSSDTESATGSLEVSVASVSVNTKHDKGDPEEEEQDKEPSRTTQLGDHVDGSDTEPNPEVEANSAIGLSSVRSLGVDTSHAVGLSEETEEGDQDDRVTPPEHAQGTSNGSTESVTTSKLPKTGKELGETTVSESETDDSVGNLDTGNVEVVKRKEQGGCRETEHCFGTRTQANRAKGSHC